MLNFENVESHNCNRWNRMKFMYEGDVLLLPCDVNNSDLPTFIMFVYVPC